MDKKYKLINIFFQQEYKQITFSKQISANFLLKSAKKSEEEMSKFKTVGQNSNLYQSDKADGRDTFAQTIGDVSLRLSVVTNLGFFTRNCVKKEAPRRQCFNRRVHIVFTQTMQYLCTEIRIDG